MKSEIVWKILFDALYWIIVSHIIIHAAATVIRSDLSCYKYNDAVIALKCAVSTVHAVDLCAAMR